jgi:hypothetical protein
MKQAADGNALAQLVEALNSSLGLQDLDSNAFVGQELERLRTDREPLPDSFGVRRGLCHDRRPYEARLRSA